MLDAIRKRSASILIKALFGLLILSFISWGVGDFVSGRASRTVVAEIGGEEIPAQLLDFEYRQELARIENLFGRRLDPEQARQLGVMEGVLARLIEQTAFDLKARDMGLIVSDVMIREQIQNTRSFLDQTGRFSRAQFEQILATNGFSEQAYVARLRQLMKRAQMIQPLRAGTAAPKPLVDALYRHRMEQRVADVFTIPDSTVSGLSDPGEDDLKAFHADHPQLFTAPEYRKVTVVTLLAENLMDEIAISEDDLRAAYESRTAEFDRPERRRVLQMLSPDRKTVDKARIRIAGGEDFTDVAEETVGMERSAVDIGEVTRNTLLPELAEAVFALDEGGLSQPVETPLGWHILKVTGIIPATRATFEEVKQNLRDGLARERALDALFDFANQLEDALGGGATLEEAAAQLNLPVRTIPAIDAQGRDVSGEPATDVPPGENFLPTVFETPEGSESLLTEAGSEGYFVARVDGVTPSALRPFETVRDEVLKAWRAEQRAEKAAEMAEAAVTRMNEGAPASAVAAEMGLAVQTSDPLTRNAFENAQKIPPALIARLFDTELGHAVMARGRDGMVVAKLAQILPANPATDPEGVEALTAELAESLQGDLQLQLTQALRDQYGVKVNRKVLEQGQ